MAARGQERLPDPSSHPIRPMLAAEGAMPAGSAWAFEFVWDGLRAIAYIWPERVRLLSASDRSLSSGYPELAALRALAAARGPLVLDGKIVAQDRLGRPSTLPLRQRMSTSNPSETLRRRVPVLFFLQDVLYLDGHWTLELPYQRRRQLLAELDISGLPAELPPYFLDTDGPTVLHAAQRHGLAGVVAKRLDSRYQSGRRSRAWVETVPRHSRQVVVGGWTPGEPEPGALLVGVPGPGGLRYLGRITTGLGPAPRRELAPRLAGVASPSSPFVDSPPDAEAKGARWVAPALVGEISYRRWDADGRVRNASWLGLCPDVRPDAVPGDLPNTVTDPAAAEFEPGSEAPPEEAPLGKAPLGKAPPGEAPGAAPATGPAAEAAAEPTAGVSAELAALDEAVRLAQAEVRALRAQISPHFVYNALTTIASYVRTDPPRARELLLDFAEYTRYSFRPGDQVTTLGAELDNSARYLALEGARFGDRLRVEREVAEELREVALPFLTVQSLVENAVRYGIEGTPRGGTVTITAVPAGADCVLTVADDGPGMDPRRLAEALADVRERLRAAPGPAVMLEVVTAPETGTTVTLRLPRPAGRLET